jgi:DNA-binding GntR family transcriptional regulator
MTAVEVYGWLEQEIIVGALKPRERLLELELCKHLGISRTLLREVFRRLEGGGLVKFHPNRGVAVRDFTPDEIEDVYSVRLVLEKMAAPLIIQKVTTDDLRTLRKLNRAFEAAFGRADMPAMVLANRDFHGQLARLSENRFLCQLLNTAFLHTHQARYLAWADKQSGQQSIREHCEILSAVAQKDLARYVRVTEKHLARGKGDYQRVFTTKRLPVQGRAVSRRGAARNTPEAVPTPKQRRKTTTP